MDAPDCAGGERLAAPADRDRGIHPVEVVGTQFEQPNGPEVGDEVDVGDVGVLDNGLGLERVLAGQPRVQVFGDG